MSEPRPAGPTEVAYAGAVSGIQTRNFGPSIDPSGPPRLAVAGVELRLVALPLVTPFRAAWGVETERLALLVRVETADGSGWGECVAMREPLYSPEYVVGALDVLRRWIVPRLFLGHPIDSIVGHQMAKSAIELALLDASCRAAGRSLQQHFGGAGERVEVGVVCDPRAIPTGYRRVKIKIQPGRDIEEIALARTAAPGVTLWADANTVYTDVDQLHPLDELGLGLIEQPFGADRLLAHADAATTLRTPLCLDETLTSAAVVEDAIQLRAMGVANIKPGRMGGYRAAIVAHDACMAAGVDAWVGGMLETGIGRAANLALASLPGFTLPGDISATDRYFHEDVTAPFVLDGNGTLAVPQGPGIGVEVLPDVLARRTVHCEILRP